MTLVRGIAEASGLAWWLVQPWLNDAGGGDVLEPTEWDQQSCPILARIERVYLEELANRRRRLEAVYGNGSSEYGVAALAVDSYKADLRARHASAELVVTGDRRAWRICGEGLPSATDVVTAATEYAYGQHHRGSGMNPYPMYSGYAHASLETLFASGGSRRPPMSQLAIAEPVELRRLVAVGARTFAASLEIAGTALGDDLASLRAWEVALLPFTLG